MRAYIVGEWEGTQAKPSVDDNLNADTLIIIYCTEGTP